ncbi:ATP-dependent protease La [Mycobacterium xenopi RIVM700367]|nr:ATP-dependent protease La [Mycobacterium xenopi RIVM700367]
MAVAKSVPVLFVSDPVVLPGMVVPIALDDTARAAVDAARASASGKLLIAPRLEDRYPSYGVLASILQVGRVAGGGTAAIVRGERRAHIGAGTTGAGSALWVEVREVVEPDPTDETRELAAEYKKLLLAMLQRREAWELVDMVNRLTDPSALADMAGYASYLGGIQKRQLLETEDVAERLRVLIKWTGDHLAEVEVNDKIAEDVRAGMEKQQKEFLLRQQLAAIRKELGEEGAAGSSADYRARVEAADLPEQVREAALREVGKLERASEQSPEGGWIRTWLDTVLDLPWNVRTEDSTDLKAAREILDADHHGLEDVKDRIVEYLAVRARRAQRGLQVVGGRGSGAVMVLAGPPGVGKTSLGESVARALGRKFVRVALGGVRDEAEIRGHRRTYVGALPGRIVRAIGEAGSMNPVVLLDEIDKVGSDFRGDPAAALLEVLDPAQNHTFRDHYLDLDLDLSDVMFLATANVVENIPSALLDRMELVAIDGYTADDKLAIARDFLLPRQRERAGLTADEVTVTEAALRKISADYTREPGVRQFDRLLAKALRKVTTRLAGGAEAPVVIDEPDLVGYLGRPRFTPESAERTAVPGVATGLAVTGLGGDVLYIEASANDGEPGTAAHRSARRRDEGVGADRAVLRALTRRRTGRRPQGAGPAHPRARARGRGAQGRAVGGCDDGDRAGVDGHRATGPCRRRDDRRGDAQWPGVADRRRQAEAARRPAGRVVNGVHPGT